MKNLKYWQSTLLTSVLAVTLLFAIPLFSSTSIAFNSNEPVKSKETSQSIPDLKKGMYIVIGAFQIMDNAIQYARVVKINGKSPLVGKYQETGLYYVYAYSTLDDLEFAREKRSELSWMLK